LAATVRTGARVMTLHILVVDDEPTNQHVLQQALIAFGHEAAVAASGPEALELLGVTKFDAVLMDLHMPRMSGLEAVKALREGDTLNRDTPAICVTADVLTRRPHDYLDLGFQGFLAKPVSLAKLAAMIDKVTSMSLEALRAERTAAKVAALQRRVAR
jgi:two-component system, sensor histidine kinase